MKWRQLFDGQPERRIAARRAIINTHINIVIGALRAEIESGWLGQEHSPLTREGHMEACRRRIAHGRGDAMIDRHGRYLLTIDAIVEEYFGGPAGRLERAVKALGRMHSADNDNDDDDDPKLTRG